MRRVHLVVLLLISGAVVSAQPAVQESRPAPATERMSNPPPRPVMQGPVPSGPFLGGVPSGLLTEGVETITIVQAMRRALEHNLGVLTAQQGLGRAEGARWRALSELLPNVRGRISETRQQINLAGVRLRHRRRLAVRRHSADCRAVQRVRRTPLRLAVGPRLRARSTTRGRRSTTSKRRGISTEGARDFVLYVAGSIYVQTLAMSARADAARAQQQTAEALYTQAVDLKKSGVIAGIDVLRSEVQLNTQRAAHDHRRQRVRENQAPARARHRPAARPEIRARSRRCPTLPVPDITLEAAVDTRLRGRAPTTWPRSSGSAPPKSARQSVVGDALPSVRVNADYGDIGLSPADARATFSVSGAVTIPIFQGGRTKGRLLEADADLREPARGGRGPEGRHLLRSARRRFSISRRRRSS